VTDCPVVVGIDVGGPNKGFHAVSLHEHHIVDQLCSLDVGVVAEWRQKQSARIIRIDAPCQLSKTGRARVAERELMSDGIWCFSTPTIAVAKAHPNDHYGWVLNGMALYAPVSAAYPLFTGVLLDGKNASFETFPHAITCALAQKVVSARRIKCYS
jgi:hypothetical protein